MNKDTERYIVSAILYESVELSNSNTEEFDPFAQLLHGGQPAGSEEGVASRKNREVLNKVKKSRGMNESEVRKIVRGVLSEYMTRRDLGDVEDFADDLFQNVGIDVEFSPHFLERLNDPRNGQEIEPEELESLFQKTYNKYGQKLPNWRRGTEAVITDFNSNINIPFVLNWNKNKEFELVGKTVMRKKNFQTSNMKLKV